MELQVIGAGLGRTGTTSLMVALEHLLNAPCYHMAKLPKHSDHNALFVQAARSKKIDWRHFFLGYAAMTDWPAAAFYKQIMEDFPKAKVLLSVRDPEAWYQSCMDTIFPKILHTKGEWGDMIREVVYQTFTSNLLDKNACMAAYNTHCEDVIRHVPQQRLILWQPNDGWLPLCEALKLDVPQQSFPHVNTKQNFLRSESH